MAKKTKGNGNPKVIGYCMSCKEKHVIEGAKEIEHPNGRTAITGKCEECGGKIFRMGGFDSIGKKKEQPAEKKEEKTKSKKAKKVEEEEEEEEEQEEEEEEEEEEEDDEPAPKKKGKKDKSGKRSRVKLD